MSVKVVLLEAGATRPREEYMRIADLNDMEEVDQTVEPKAGSVLTTGIRWVQPSEEANEHGVVNHQFARLELGSEVEHLQHIPVIYLVHCDSHNVLHDYGWRDFEHDFGVSFWHTV